MVDNLQHCPPWFWKWQSLPTICLDCWPASPRDPFICTASPGPGLQTHTTKPSFLRWCWERKSSPHACMTDILLTQPSPQLQSKHFERSPQTPSWVFLCISLLTHMRQAQNVQPRGSYTSLIVGTKRELEKDEGFCASDQV